MLSCKFRFALSIAVFLWGAPAPAQTLTTGTIVGAVTDSSGAVVRGADCHLGRRRNRRPSDRHER